MPLPGMQCKRETCKSDVSGALFHPRTSQCSWAPELGLNRLQEGRCCLCPPSAAVLLCACQVLTAGEVLLPKLRRSSNSCKGTLRSSKGSCQATCRTMYLCHAALYVQQILPLKMAGCMLERGLGLVSCPFKPHTSSGGMRGRQAFRQERFDYL